ncbi:GT4 family glycosyltransferase PelF [Propioniciclava soli]|uniref:GT4 family glycosyltransferase PelF n=1 Tax=Propioniciclava soli TaxID=2775081 RepID=A0ABZ3C6P5_9ACTN|nr:GT4 family glycosyltransferase PelF [Propioniciclava soli]
MRIALLNEGTYPVAKGGVSTWCDQLLTHLPEHTFDVVTIVGLERTPVWDAPANVASTTCVPMWDAHVGTRPWRPRTTGRELRRTREALRDLWAAVLPSNPADPENIDRLRDALGRLAVPSYQALDWLLTQTGSTRPILEAWQAHRVHVPGTPALTASDAAAAAVHADRALALMDADWPEVDVIHATSNGPAALMALARHWRTGTPLLLTEHGVFLRERYLALHAAGWPWNVRYVLLAFLRSVCTLAYTDAEIIAPVNFFNGRWETRLGADPERIQPVYNGVDPSLFPMLESEPADPVVSFVGRIDPLKDLATLIDAFALVMARVPDARLRLFGPVPAGNEAYHATLVEQVALLGLGEVVTFEGPAPSARPAIEAGQVVALSSISEGLPFTVLEAMMQGRPTVSTDVGGVAECTGRDGAAGLIVPPREPAAMADALVTLLTDADARHAMGLAARERALEVFSLQVFADTYRAVYDDAAARAVSARVATLVPDRAGGVRAAATVLEPA